MKRRERAGELASLYSERARGVGRGGLGASGPLREVGDRGEGGREVEMEGPPGPGREGSVRRNFENRGPPMTTRANILYTSRVTA